MAGKFFGAKAIIFFIVFVSQLGYGILFPLMSLYEQKMHVGPFAIAAVMGAYAIAQFFAAPIMGVLSDRHGRRPLLLFSLVGTSIAFLMFAFANNIYILFLARLIDGISGGNISIAQAYMADISPREKRAESMGLISGAISLGFMVGPIVGGIFGQFGVMVPSLVAAFMSAINLIITFLFLKEVERSETRERALKILPFKEMMRALKIPGVSIALILFFLLQMTWSLHFPIFSLFLDAKFGMGALATGLLLSYRAAISSLVQIVLVKYAVKFFDERLVLKWAAVVMIVGLLLTGVAPSLLILIIALTILEFGGDFIGPITLGIVSKQAEPAEQGEMMGVAASMGSLGRTLGPYLGGAAFQELGVNSPFIIGAVMMGMGLLTLIFR